ncbi:hypothetical protein H4R34_000783 [Dimargaris verticillata]|uniref:RCC1-like domain-containing protein n=1 Tax=Dimargaris verticillata TaxID=2761393 RepID=A0A9W8EED0_9FUNG|nr:hypothetical protein H4R34_000783 [Dimargaris verticillata]
MATADRLPIQTTRAKTRPAQLRLPRAIDPALTLVAQAQRQCLPQTHAAVLGPTELAWPRAWPFPRSIAAVAAGHMFSMVSFQDSDCGAWYLAAFGVNSSGQLGIAVPNPPEFSSFLYHSQHPIVSLACGRAHALVLLRDTHGSTHLYTCGHDAYGQLGRVLDATPTANQQRAFGSVSQPVGPLSRLRAVVAGLDHSVLLTTDDEVYTMGWGSDGQLGLGPDFTGCTAIPAPVTGLGRQRIQKVATGADFTLVLTESGQLYAWGNSEYGQAMLGHKVDRILEPVVVPFSHGVRDVACGGTHALVLTDASELYTCGYGVLGLGPDQHEALQPTRLPWPAPQDPPTRVYCGPDYSACLTESGALYLWGVNRGFAPAPAPRLIPYPQRVDLHPATAANAPVVFSHLACGSYHALALGSAQTLPEDQPLQTTAKIP